ncbi:MGMT family protein [Candidatus Micrarchaeota archaeon]|nr:MGMT family protein [Candidatus Micrarchaeota archaeon]
MDSFGKAVLVLVEKIPRGKVTTYGELARALGKPNAARAVGKALNKNPHPIKVPCHRVVRSDGRVGGYALGARKKVKLLKKEGVEIKNDRVNLKKYFYSFQ